MLIDWVAVPLRRWRRGSNTADLDFASVQRGNPEIQRRAQEVIDACWQMGDKNPIMAIHDVGAGGLLQRISPNWRIPQNSARISSCARCRSKSPA